MLKNNIHLLSTILPTYVVRLTKNVDFLEDTFKSSYFFKYDNDKDPYFVKDMVYNFEGKFFLKYTPGIILNVNPPRTSINKRLFLSLFRNEWINILYELEDTFFFVGKCSVWKNPTNNLNDVCKPVFKILIEKDTVVMIIENSLLDSRYKKILNLIQWFIKTYKSDIESKIALIDITFDTIYVDDVEEYLYGNTKKKLGDMVNMMRYNKFDESLNEDLRKKIIDEYR